MKKGSKMSKEARKKMSLARLKFFASGGTPWNKGLSGLPGYWTGKQRPSPSEATRLKMSLAQKKRQLSDDAQQRIAKGHAKSIATRKGKKLSLEHRIKLSLAKTGQSEFDGFKLPSSNRQRSIFLTSVQPRVLARDNYTCQVCNLQKSYLHVDHIQSWAQYPELRFEMDNCRTICRECHYKKTFGKTMPKNSRWGITNGKLQHVP